VGTYYRWKCDSMKEFFDPDELLGPDCAPGRGYGVKGGAIPHSAWVVAVLQLDRWYGHPVRLVGDGDDDWECEGYSEVSQYVLRTLIYLAPTEALRFLNREVSAVAPDAIEDLGEFKVHAEREELISRLTNWARKDWPRLCTTLSCHRYGERHDGVCDLELEVEESREVPKYREFVVGMARVEVEPGGVVVRGVKPVSSQVSQQHPGYEALFRVERIVFADWMVGNFVLQKVTVRGDGLSDEQEVLTVGDFPIVGPLSVNLVLGPGQSIEVTAKNVSTSKQVFAVALFGIVKERK
jgi:hypothetical protein